MPVTFTTQIEPPTGLSVDSVDEDDISISWTDASSVEDGYKVYRSTDNSNFTEVADLASGSSSYSNTGLQDGTDYYYYIESYNATDSGSSTTVSLTILDPPTNFSIDEIDGGTYKLSWTVNETEGQTDVKISANGGESFVTDASLALSEESHTTSEYFSKNEHILKVTASITDSNYDSETITARLAGSTPVHDGDGVETETSGEVLTE
jgi:hypothetical protein